MAIDLALGGERLSATRARAMGLIDEVCPRAILVDVAARRAKALAGHVPRGAERAATMPAPAPARGPDRAAIALEENPRHQAAPTDSSARGRSPGP